MTVTAPSGAGTARFVGQSVQRREDPRLLTGRGQYIADVELRGMLQAHVVRSEVARGDIVRLDVEAARALAGVHAVYTAAELNPLVHETWWNMAGRDAVYPPKYALADQDVRFVGDPIAIIVADSRYIAEDAAELIDLEIAPRPPLLDPAAVLAGDEYVHPELGTNSPQRIPAMPNPELDAAFDAAERVASATFAQHRYVAVPMETRGIVADWDLSSGRLQIWASTQSAHELRGFYARLLGMSESDVRVLTPDVGGGFGLKVLSMRDEWSVVLAAKLVGRPVAWIEDRRENLIASAHARKETMELTLAADAEGHLQAMRGVHVEDVGAYPYAASASAGAMVGLFFSGAYKVARTSYDNTVVYTNTCGRAPYRGPFLIQTVATEQMIDVAAREWGIDPLEMRRRNVLRSADLPYTLPSMLSYDAAITPAETLEQAAQLIDYDQFRIEQTAARAGGRYLGIGISLCVEPSAIAFGALSTEGVYIRIEPSGKVNVILSSSSTGMSIETTIVQVVAEHLGCNLDDIAFFQGDTTVTPYGAGTQGSRSAVLYGNVARDGAEQLQEKVRAIAAHMLEAAEDDLEITAGRVSVKGAPGSSVTFAQVGEMAYVGTDLLPPGVTPGLEVSARYKASSPFTFSNACHMCTVDVDLETGLVNILRYVVSEDCGQMINPQVVEGQIFGGVVQGIGGVLYEHMQYDDAGNPLTTTFVDYLLPTPAEVPVIEVGHVASVGSNPLGVKGMGEGGAVASPAAVFNAVADALAPLGVQLRSTPLGPEQIFQAVRSARLHMT